jgi:hypothetical protein
MLANPAGISVAKSETGHTLVPLGAEQEAY